MCGFRSLLYNFSTIEAILDAYKKKNSRRIRSLIRSAKSSFNLVCAELAYNLLLGNINFSENEFLTERERLRKSNNIRWLKKLAGRGPIKGPSAVKKKLIDSQEGVTILPLLFTVTLPTVLSILSEA